MRKQRPLMNWALLRLLKHSQSLMVFGGLLTGIGILIIAFDYNDPNAGKFEEGVFVTVVGLVLAIITLIYTRSVVLPQLRNRLPDDEGGNEP